MAHITTGNASQTSEHDRELLEKLEDVINGDERPVLLGREGAHIQFPEPLFHVLTKAVRMMASGQAVMLLSENEEFTTQAAANHLGMSRPHLIKLLDRDEIAFHYVGTHRRIYLKNLKEFEVKRDRGRRQSLDTLADKVIEAGLDSADYTG
ncbi:MAG: excisionase family DNA-binding protein [Planctomycetales bacterium]|jgi:excisionase family DNA binding protein